MIDKDAQYILIINLNNKNTGDFFLHLIYGLYGYMLKSKNIYLNIRLFIYFSRILCYLAEEMSLVVYKKIIWKCNTRCSRNISYILNCHLPGASELKKVAMVAPFS